MRRLKIIVTRSVTLLALAAIFYVSAPLATPTTTDIAFRRPAQEIHAADGINTPRKVSKHIFPSSFSSSDAITPAQNASALAAYPLINSASGNGSFPGVRIQLASAAGFYKPVLPAAPAFQAEPAGSALIMPNIQGSEGVGIFFMFWTALSMLYLARRR